MVGDQSSHEHFWVKGPSMPQQEESKKQQNNSINGEKKEEFLKCVLLYMILDAAFGFSAVKMRKLTYDN